MARKTTGGGIVVHEIEDTGEREERAERKEEEEPSFIGRDRLCAVVSDHRDPKVKKFEQNLE
jgi:hypothetical protein